MEEVQKMWDEYRSQNKLRWDLSSKGKWSDIEWLYIDGKKGDIGFKVDGDYLYELFNIRKWRRPNLYIHGIKIKDQKPFEPLFEMLKKFGIEELLKKEIKNNRW